MLRLLRRHQNVHRRSRVSRHGSPSETGVSAFPRFLASLQHAQPEHRLGGSSHSTPAQVKTGAAFSIVRTYGVLCSFVCLETCRYHQRQHRRGAHTNGVYIHHTTGLSADSSMAVTIGVFHALQSSRSKVGFFTPIEVPCSPHSCSRCHIMKHIFKLEDSEESLRGVTHAEAFDLIEANKMDDLLEEILRAYKAFRTKHEFLVVEGASLKRAGDDMTVLNAKIAATLGLPVLVVTDARKAANIGERKIVRWDKLEWEREIALSTQLTASVMKRNFVEVLGALIHRLPDTLRDEAYVIKHFEDLKIPYFGGIPEDSVLKCIKVDEIVDALGAHILHETHDAIGRAKESSKFVLATKFSDLLAHLKSIKDTGESLVLITDNTSLDSLLGSSDLYPSLSAIIVAGGSLPHPEAAILVQRHRTQNLPPIMYCSHSHFEIAATLADLEGQILPSSTKKIEHSKMLFDKHINKSYMNKLLSQDRIVPVHPKVFQNSIFSTAKKSMQHIVLPEGDEPRIIQAAGILLKHGVCKLTMLGELDKIKKLAEELQVDLSHAHLVTPSESESLSKYSQYLFEARKHKGMTHDEAQKKLLSDANYFGTCMVALGDADGMVSGAVHTTANTVRPALQLIKTEPGLKIASSVFFMCLQGRILVFGDCAINTDPTSEELSLIAIASANTAAAFGIEPRVAFLSYATGDSNSGPLIQKVADAVVLVKKKKPDLAVDGPLQYDAAVNPETARIKMKGKDSHVAGKATVLIFPDLNTGNTTYKAVQQSTGALAMGPVIQGLKKPVNDLSRGCTIGDIVSTVAITAVQAASVKQRQHFGRVETMAGA